MLLIALITAGLVSNAHAGAAPVVSAPVSNAPAVVFDRPAPVSAKPASPPVKSRPLPTARKAPTPAAAPPLAHGVPLVAAPLACYQYFVNPALDPKYQAIVNPEIQEPACISTPPGAPFDP